MVILCDSQWSDPDLDSSNGIQMGLRDMLRIDSMLMMVQLNIRVLLEVSLPISLYSCEPEPAYTGQQPVQQSVCPYVCPYIHTFVCLSVCLSLCYSMQQVTLTSAF